MRPDPLRCLVVGLFLALGLPAGSTLLAQETPQLPAPPGPPGRQSLILQEAVQADLNLSDKQKSQLNSLQASFGQKSRDTFQALQESGAGPEEFQEGMASLHREHLASLVRVLDKNQKARLKELELQREGFLAASRSEIASKLKLNAQQTKKIKTIVDEMRRETAKAMPGLLGGLQADGSPAPKSAGAAKAKKGTTKGRRPAPSGAGNDEMGGDGEFVGGGLPGGGFPGAGMPGGGPPGGLPPFLKPENLADFAKFEETQKKLRDEASTKIGEVLTAEQKTAFEKLTGKPFDFADGKTAPATAPKVEEPAKKEEPAKPQPKPKMKNSRGD